MTRRSRKTRLGGPPSGPGPSPTLQEAVRRFLVSYLPQHRGASPHTISSYAQALRGVLDHLAGRTRTRKEPTVHDLTAENILSYLASLEADRGNSAGTRNARLAGIRAFLRYAYLLGCLERAQKDRLLHIAFKRSPPKLPVYLDTQELQAIFRSVDYTTRDGFRDLLILKLLYNTGARASEMASIRISDLDLEALHLAVRGKGGRRRICPLWQSTAALVRIYLASERRTSARGFEDHLFVSQRRHPFTRSGIHALVRRHAARARAACSSLAKKKVTPHTFRHTTSVHLVEAGIDLNTIREWLGHAHIATTELYARPNLGTKRRALATLEHLDRKLFDDAAASRSSSPIDSATRRWMDSLGG